MTKELDKTAFTAAWEQWLFATDKAHMDRDAALKAAILVYLNRAQRMPDSEKSLIAQGTAIVAAQLRKKCILGNPDHEAIFAAGRDSVLREQQSVDVPLLDEIRITDETGYAQMVKINRDDSSPHQVKIDEPSLSGLQRRRQEAEASFLESFDAIRTESPALNRGLPMSAVRVGMKLKSTTSDFTPVITVTEITDKGFKFSHPPRNLGPRYGTVEGGECFGIGGYSFYESVQDDQCEISEGFGKSRVADPDYIAAQKAENVRLSALTEQIALNPKPAATEQPVDRSALDEALLTMRPQVWADITQQVMLGEIPAAQLPMRVEMWQQQFRPYLENAIRAYLAAAPERESGSSPHFAVTALHEIAGYAARRAYFGTRFGADHWRIMLEDIERLAKGALEQQGRKS